jgi:hypothetical protein
MGDGLIWLLLGSFIVILFCIYSLSSQVERCVHLAVEIITGNQRRILEQLELLTGTRSTVSHSGYTTLERRVQERRSAQPTVASAGERRSSPGRRREDRVVNLRG